MTAPAGKMRWPVRNLSRVSGDTRTRRSGENWAIVAGKSLLRPSAHSLQAPGRWAIVTSKSKAARRPAKACTKYFRGAFDENSPLVAPPVGELSQSCL